jgi:hypothetical protein
MGPDNYTLTKSFPVEGGVNRFLIRSTTTPGTISVNASSGGLQGDKLMISSKPFVTENGLAKVLPSDGLTSHLDRGPTPLTPSFQITRKPIGIKSVNAGANADSASATYDDNELSDWANDGKLNTAWVEYELENVATLSEVTLKLNNFKSRAYPLRITVDGKLAFNGITEPTLGYYTIICTTPQKGKRVRVELTGPAITKEKSIGLEITGKKLDDGVKREVADGKGTLAIIEIELYEPVSSASSKVAKSSFK